MDGIDQLVGETTENPAEWSDDQIGASEGCGYDDNLVGVAIGEQAKQDAEGDSKDGESIVAEVYG